MTSISRVSYIDPFQGAVMANFANKGKGSVNCALIIESGDDYSAGFGNYFQKEMERAWAVRLPYWSSRRARPTSPP